MSSSLETFLDSMQELGMMAADYMQESLKNDPFAQQKIYEKWIREDEWRLHDQAIPLALGLDPQAWQEFLASVDHKAECDRLLQAIQDVIAENQGPQLTNPSDPVQDWRVPAGGFYGWVNANGITVPDAMDGIMQFVMTVVKKSEPAPHVMSSEANISAAQAMIREQVLGAAINIVSKEPDACRDPSGLTNAQALAAMIAAQSVRWFDQPTPPMNVEKMTELLEKWLD